MSPARVFFVVWAIYNLNFAYLGSADTLPDLLLPANLVLHGDVYLERYGLRIRGTPPRHEPYMVQEIGGHIVSNYPILPSLLAAPVYLAPTLVAKWVDPDAKPARSFPLYKWLGKITASLFTALAAALVYAAARRWDPGGAAVVAAAFAFASTAFSIASQGMWQHGPALLLLALAVERIARDPLRRGDVAAAGLAGGLAIACRPSALGIVAVLFLYVVHRRRADAIAFVTPLALIGAGVLLYNLALYHHVLGGYAMLRAELAARQHVEPEIFGSSFLEGFAGLLVSPARGLLVFSPYALFAFWGMALVWGRGAGREPGRLLLRYLAAGAVGQILFFATYPAWWGGMGYGPRYLCEASVPLALLLVPALARLPGRSAGRRLLVLLVAAGVAVHAIGVFGDSLSWYSRYKVDRNHAMLWSWRNGEIAHALTGTQVGNLFRRGVEAARSEE